jgi:hypothetical protein
MDFLRKYSGSSIAAALRQDRAADCAGPEVFGHRFPRPSIFNPSFSREAIAQHFSQLQLVSAHKLDSKRRSLQHDAAAGLPLQNDEEVHMLGALIRVGLFGLAIAVMTHSDAAATKNIKIGTRTKEYMKSLCTGEGRQYVEGQGKYGCISNCGDSNQASDACGINCNESDNQCEGWSPGTQQVRSPSDILGPRAPILRGGLLERGPGMPTQGPAATGVASPPRAAPAGTLK